MRLAHLLAATIGRLLEPRLCRFACVTHLPMRGEP